MPANLTRGLIIFPAGAGKIPANNTFDRQRLGPANNHRTTSQLGTIWLQLGRKLREVGGHKMIRRQLNFLKPESRNLIQNRALERNRIGQNDVEGGKAIGRNEEQRF